MEADFAGILRLQLFVTEILPAEENEADLRFGVFYNG